MFFLAFALLFAFAASEWSKPVNVIPSYKKSFATFTDNSNGVSHIFWCSSPDLKFNYRRLNPDNTVSSVQVFNWEQPCDSLYDLKGAHNGASIYFVFQAQRKRGLAKDCTKNPASCRDIFFTESANGGTVWSVPKAVSHKNAMDVQERLYPQLLVGNNNRLWIFYRAAGVLEAPLRYAMRAPNSALFSEEEILPVVASSFSLKQTTGIRSNAVSIFFTRHDDGNRYHYYTENNGISWEGPVTANSLCEKSIMLKEPFGSDSALSHLFWVCSVNHTEYLTLWGNEGSIRQTIPFPEFSYFDSFAVSGDNKKNGYLAYCYETVYYMSFSEKEFKKTRPPPSQNRQRCQILTSSYNSKRFWFWYATYNHDVTTSLWVTSMPIEELTTDTQ
eukprot:TRINITY_DN5432_c0_g3_i1.p1 TRINITY_DN5432_c0_g3~~TRINITY_DN5432_c0_g3_i1.p1  ORF type:complete len:387 (+),score=83.08 TRINITY_DN5432_c0_g3_i1:169-1329(+)